MRVIVVDSDERRSYEEGIRRKSMDGTRIHREKLQKRVAAGKLNSPRESELPLNEPWNEPRLSLLFLGHPPGKLPLLREPEGPEA